MTNVKSFYFFRYDFVEQEKQPWFLAKPVTGRNLLCIAMKKRITGYTKLNTKPRKRFSGDYARSIVETAHESLLMLTDTLRIRHANQSFYKTFGITPEETEGLDLYEIANGQWNIPVLKEQLTLLKDKNIPFTHLEITQDFPVIGRRTIWLNANKFSMAEEKGKMILLAIQDVSEQKNLEEKTRENEERLQLLIHNASDIITVLDETGSITYESPAIESALGYKPEERVGKNIHTDSIVHPDDRQIKIKLLQKSVESPTENIRGEFRLQHKDGTYRTIDAIFNNMLHNPKINGVIATYRDITDRKILENHKDEFIAIVSHELKTPVTSLKAYLQILEENMKEPDGEHADLLFAKMNTQVDKLTTLIRDLLDFARVDSGRLDFREEEYELNELVLEISEELQSTTKQHEIHTSLSRPVIIFGDRYRTGQVITNLLSNAIKYSPKANKIIISTVVEKDQVTVFVQDFGIGIEASFQQKVFDRFFRGNEIKHHHFPGLGLGLYIAAEFIKRQGGQIGVTSEPGNGSTFFFSLPMSHFTKEKK
jgi:PAS domain S-box-containing protein